MDLWRWVLYAGLTGWAALPYFASRADEKGQEGRGFLLVGLWLLPVALGGLWKWLG